MSKSSFLAELKCRNVYRAAVFYTRTARLLAQIATRVAEFFHIRGGAHFYAPATRVCDSAKQPEAVSNP